MTTIEGRWDPCCKSVHSGSSICRVLVSQLMIPDWLPSDLYPQSGYRCLPIENHILAGDVHVIAGSPCYKCNEPTLPAILRCLLFSCNRDSHAPKELTSQVQRIGISSIDVTTASAAIKPDLCVTNFIFGGWNVCAGTQYVRIWRTRPCKHIIICQAADVRSCVPYACFLAFPHFFTPHSVRLLHRILGIRMFHHNSQLLFPWPSSTSPTSCPTKKSSQ